MTTEKKPFQTGVLDLRKSVPVQEFDESWALELLEDQELESPGVPLQTESLSAIQLQARKLEEAKRSAEASNDSRHTTGALRRWLSRIS